MVDIISPHDESWDKLDFYLDADVEELVMVDPPSRTVTWLARTGDGWTPTEHSDLLASTLPMSSARSRSRNHF